MALTKVWPFGGQKYAKSTATTSPPGGADRQLNTHYADRDGQKTETQTTATDEAQQRLGTSENTYGKHNITGPQGDCSKSRRGSVELMWTALTIADEILKIAKRKSIKVTPMKLMKLVYIAHGWALAVLQRDLFTDRIEAWKYGPVIPNLYQATKQFGRNEIPLHLIEENAPTSVDDQHVLTFLVDVVEKYGQLNGIQLSKLTHMPGTPWDQTYEPNSMGREIHDDLIRDHYKAKLNEYRLQSTPSTQ